jgi:hypothetical protein
MSDEIFISRAELQQRIDKFGSSLPGLIRSNPGESLLSAKLTMVADDLVEDTLPVDRSWAIDRFNEILLNHGLPRLDHDLDR